MRQDIYSALSLQAGLELFRIREGLAEKAKATRQEARLHLDRHDIAHVLLGLDTSPDQEALVDIWTVFGTNATLSDIMTFLQLPEEKEILKEIGCWTVTGTSIRALPKISKVARAARKQSAKWPWRDYHALLERKVEDIRADFRLPDLLH